MGPAASDDDQKDRHEPASTEDMTQPSPTTPAEAAEAQSTSDVMAEPAATAPAPATVSARDTMGNGTLPAPVEDRGASGAKSAADKEMDAAVTTNPAPEPGADVQAVPAQVDDTPTPARAASESEAVTESAVPVAEPTPENDS